MPVILNVFILINIENWRPCALSVHLVTDNGIGDFLFDHYKKFDILQAFCNNSYNYITFKVFYHVLIQLIS